MPSTPRRRAIRDPEDRDPLGKLFGDFPDRLRGDIWEPAVDVFEAENSVLVRVEIAGVRSDDLRVSIDRDLLRISGVRRPPTSLEVRRLHQMEIAFGPFERAIRIAMPFERDRVAAHLEDGFLEIRVPKCVPVQRRVEVKTE
jgi:HSP20 family protein